MMYKAKNIDTDKALEYLQKLEFDDQLEEAREMKEIAKYHEGFRDGLRRAINMFGCSNYEKDAESQVIKNESNIS